MAAAALAAGGAGMISSGIAAISTYAQMLKTRAKDYIDATTNPTLRNLLRYKNSIKYVPSESLARLRAAGPTQKAIADEDESAGLLFFHEVIRLLVATANYSAAFARISAVDVRRSSIQATRRDILGKEAGAIEMMEQDYNILRRFFLFIFCATKASNARAATNAALRALPSMNNARGNRVGRVISGTVFENMSLRGRIRGAVIRQMIRLTESDITTIKAIINDIEYTDAEIAAEAALFEPEMRIKAKIMNLKAAILRMTGSGDAFEISGVVPLILLAFYDETEVLAMQLGGYDPRKICLTLERQTAADAAVAEARDARISAIIEAEDAAAAEALANGTLVLGPNVISLSGVGLAEEEKPALVAALNKIIVDERIMTPEQIAAAKASVANLTTRGLSAASTLANKTSALVDSIRNKAVSAAGSVLVSRYPGDDDTRGSGPIFAAGTSEADPREQIGPITGGPYGSGWREPGEGVRNNGFRGRSRSRSRERVDNRVGPSGIGGSGGAAAAGAPFGAGAIGGHGYTVVSTDGRIRFNDIFTDEIFANPNAGLAAIRERSAAAGGGGGSNMGGGYRRTHRRRSHTHRRRAHRVKASRRRPRSSSRKAGRR
jgi:hypothetical protein